MKIIYMLIYIEQIIYNFQNIIPDWSVIMNEGIYPQKNNIDNKWNCIKRF